MTLQGGLQQMTDRLAAAVEKSRVLMGRCAFALEFAPGGPGGVYDSCARRFQIVCQGNARFDADAVILALPAYISGGLDFLSGPSAGRVTGATFPTVRR